MKKFNIKNKIFILSMLGLLLPTNIYAQESIDPNFDPGLLISDAAFSDTATFGSAAGVQQFLASKNSVLARTDEAFLTKLREPANVDWKTRLDDPQASLGRLRTAAELIYDASASAGLNPQVIIVTLQKEQTLITKTFATDADLQRALDRALGYGCPDNQPCQASFLGFYPQLFGTFDASNDRWIGAAKSLSKSFTYEVNGVRVGRGPLIDAQNQAFGSGPFVRPSRQGDSVVFENTLNGFSGIEPSQTVTLKNYATAALYRYTPHVFNGNYNFWRFYQAWFRYPNGTVIKLSSDSTVWVIDNGLRRQFSSYVAEQRGINIANPVIVSPTEFNSYVEGSRLTLKDGTIVKGDTDAITYLIEGSKRHKVTDFTATQRKLNLAGTATLPQSEVDSYELGPILLPLDGTLLKASDSAAVYVMVGAQKRPITFTVFQQRQYKFPSVVTLPTAEVAEIPTGNLMHPLDNTLIKGAATPAVYMVESGAKRIISGTVFKQRNLSFRNLLVLSDTEVAAMPSGLPLPPLDNTLIKTAVSPAVYVVWQGIKIPITATVFTLRQLNIKPIVVLSDDEVQALPTDDFALPPRDGTLLKASNDATIYLVDKEQLRPLTYQVFVNRRYRFNQVLTFDPGEINLFEKGEIIAN